MISGALANETIKTFDLLDQIITVLGSTKTTFWPLLESQDDNRDDLELYSYKESVHTLSINGDATEPFYPYRHIGGIHSLSFDAAENQFLSSADSIDFTFKTSGQNEDDPFSVGLWILPRDITSVTLMAKYDTNAAREWRFHINGSNKLVFDLYDEDVDKTEIGTSGTSVSLNEWTFVVFTYDGTETAPVIAFYQNAVADATTDTTEVAGYINMEDLGTALTIGADLATGAAANEYTGRIALPFVCGKELSAANVTTLHGLGQRLLGLAY